MGLMDLFKGVQVPPLMEWDGPDDLWPPEPVPEEIDKSIVTREWGLKLPGGDVVWGSWQGVPFDNPLDRVHMIAKIKQTAQDSGWDPEEFFVNYSWVTRNAYTTVDYQLTEAYSLMDPAVSGTPSRSLNEGES
jgi:hypothetical protein